jgi:hypothetical protein
VRRSQGSFVQRNRRPGKAQAEIAAALKIKQPSVSKIERQADMYLSTLRSYVQAIGGELDLVVRLPSRAPVRLHRLGDLLDASPNTAAPRRRRVVDKAEKPPRKEPATSGVGSSASCFRSW